MSISNLGMVNAAAPAYADPLMAPSPVPGVSPSLYSGDLFGPPMAATTPRISQPEQAAAVAEHDRHHKHVLHLLLGGLGVVVFGTMVALAMRKPIPRSNGFVPPAPARFKNHT